MTDGHVCVDCGEAVLPTRYGERVRWPARCVTHRAERARRWARRRGEAGLWLAVAAIAVGVDRLAGIGAALICAGVLSVLNMSADVWLPALIARQGRRHESDARARHG